MNSLITVTLTATLTIGQGGGKTAKSGTTKSGGKTATLITKTPEMEKLETDFGANILVNEPGPGLVSLSISGSKATDAVMVEIAKIKGLDDVLIGSGAITDKGVAALAKAKSIRRLFLLKCTKLTAACITDLAAMPKLATLQISQVDLDLKSLKSLSGMKSLRSLLLTRCGVEDDDLEAFAANRRLRALNLAGNDEIKGKGLEHLKGMAQLTFIDLVGTKVSSLQLEALVDAIDPERDGSLEVRGDPGILGFMKTKPAKAKKKKAAATSSP